MLPTHIKSASDLQTKHSSVCKGFLEQALQKTKVAKPYLEEAVQFNDALQKTKSVEDLLSSIELRGDLAYACGFSDKARSKLTNTELSNAIKTVVARIYEESREKYKEEILYRYLLTRGDSLGGRMRNLMGISADNKLTKEILKQLESINRVPAVTRRESGKIQRLSWGERTLLFDVTPRVVKKNIDVILVESDDPQLSKEKLLSRKQNFLALGELKGGIDPAGADEHWKTANSALDRIRTVFNPNIPPLFFVGAAIEISMSNEIFKQLRTGELAYAANLNYPEQLSDLVGWLLSL